MPELSGKPDLKVKAGTCAFGADRTRRGPAGGGLRLARTAYAFIFHLLLPWAMLRLLWDRAWRRDPGIRVAQRLGLGLPGPRPGPVLWLHAVSVGEVMCARSLLESMLRAAPPVRVIVTTVTATGAEAVRRLFGERIEHAYLPLDAPWAVRRFLEHARPQLGLIVETELWPELFLACRERCIPLMLVNARLSVRSARLYRFVAPIVRATLDCVEAAAVQSDEDGRRFAALGLDPVRMRVTGNLKFGNPPMGGVAGRAQALREELWPHQNVWIAASTHAGEDEQVLDAHRRVLQAHDQAVLLLAPRHPRRAARIARLAARAGFPVTLLRGSGRPPVPASVYVIESLGDMMFWYACADVAFVGGSLIAHGGHNLAEPASLGLPVITGEHCHNVATLATPLQQADALMVVDSATSLAESITQLLAEPASRVERGARAREVFLKQQGALPETLSVILPFLIRTGISPVRPV